MNNVAIKEKVKIKTKIYSDFFSQNAYYKLGLTPFAGQKEILRRSKEIVARLKINDVPVYKEDLKFLPPKRDTNSIKQAIQDLSNPKNRLKNHFFWIEINSQNKELIESENFRDVIRLWEKATNSKAEQFYAKKNILLLRTLLLYQCPDKFFVREILRSWKNLLENKDLWKAFEERYFTEDELGCSSQIFRSFSKEVVEHISNIFIEISKLHENPFIIKECSVIFNTTGLRVISDILTPIFETLNDVAEKLEKLNVSEDGILDDEEKKLIFRYVRTIENQIEELNKHGLKNDSKVCTVRDRVADAIRSVVLDMCNNLGEMDYANLILNRALKIAGTEGEKQHISRDIRVIQGIQSHTKILTPIINMIEGERFDEALNEIEKLEQENKTDSSLQETLIIKKKECVIHKAIKMRSKGIDEFTNNNLLASASTLKKTYNFLNSHMEIFDLNAKAIQEKIIVQVKENVESTTIDDVEQLEEIRNKDIEFFKEKFDTRYEGYYLILIYDSIFYGELAGKARKLSFRASIGSFLETVITYILFFILLSVFYSCSG